MIRNTAVALVAVFALSACGERGSLVPPEIHYGQDVCAACNMIISEERFATAIVLESQEGGYTPAVFDDIGCLFEYEKKRTALPIAARYVHDHESTTWIDAALAVYVRSPTLQTPMGSGVIASRTKELAQSLLTKHDGKLLSWDELSTMAAEKGLLAAWSFPGEE